VTNSPSIRCLIISNKQTLHQLDETRSKPGSAWSICSQHPQGERRITSLTNAQQELPHFVPCAQCFPHRRLPSPGSIPITTIEEPG
jgi:hypothetical protein